MICGRVVQFQDMPPLSIPWIKSHDIPLISSQPATHSLFGWRSSGEVGCIADHIQFRIGGIQFSPLGCRGTGNEKIEAAE